MPRLIQAVHGVTRFGYSWSRFVQIGLSSWESFSEETSLDQSKGYSLIQSIYAGPEGIFTPEHIRSSSVQIVQENRWLGIAPMLQNRQV